jgi:hypothetical protein
MAKYMLFAGIRHNFLPEHYHLEHVEGVQLSIFVGSPDRIVRMYVKNVFA